MQGYMNEEAFKKTISLGEAVYFSRSRNNIWKKGETSGMCQEIQRILIDDDQDCIVLEVTLTQPDVGGDEASCHVGYRSCFYREIVCADSGPKLSFIESKKSFDPVAVYGDIPNPTQL